MECGFICQVEIASNIAVILAFFFTGITFLVVFRRNRKDEQIKMAMELLKQLSDSDNLLTNTLLQYRQSNSIDIYVIRRLPMILSKHP